MNYSIIRDGKAIELTNEEIRDIVRRDGLSRFRYEVEDHLKAFEEDEHIDFSDYSSSGSEYASAEDAREDFIEQILETIDDIIQTYDHDPHGYHPNYDDLISDLADDLGYWKE